MSTEYQDRDLTCVCGNVFIWTAGEQTFIYDLLEKGKLDEEQPDGTVRPGRVIIPKRCKECRAKKKAEREGH